MKRNILIFAAVLLVMLFIILLGGSYSNKNLVPVAPSHTATSSKLVLGAQGQITIKNNTWDVEIVADDASRAQGLSNRQALDGKNGMLFVFDQPDNHPFWMKDMLIPLDMIFFDDNWKIVLVEPNVLPNSFPKIFGHGVESKYVLEVNAGEAKNAGLAVGNQAIFTNK